MKESIQVVSSQEWKITFKEFGPTKWKGMNKTHLREPMMENKK